VNEVVEDFDFWGSVDLHVRPIHIGVNADNLTLAVAINKNGVAHLLLFDIRAFANKVSSPYLNKVSRPYLNNTRSSFCEVACKSSSSILEKFQLFLLLLAHLW
jgi:hypothetical protein